MSHSERLEHLSLTRTDWTPSNARHLTYPTIASALLTRKDTLKSLRLTGVSPWSDFYADPARVSDLFTAFLKLEVLLNILLCFATDNVKVLEVYFRTLVRTHEAYGGRTIDLVLPPALQSLTIRMGPAPRPALRRVNGHLKQFADAVGTKNYVPQLKELWVDNVAAAYNERGMTSSRHDNIRVFREQDISLSFITPVPA